jgi:hypothetical protein
MWLGGHLSTRTWRDTEAVELMQRDYGRLFTGNWRDTEAVALMQRDWPSERPPGCCAMGRRLVNAWKNTLVSR